MTSGMTTAERRGYQQICGKNGLMMVVACDQRGGMRKVLADTPEAQAAIDEAALGVVKAGIVQHLANKASCVLLDAVCAVPDVVDQGVLGSIPNLGRANVLGAAGFAEAEPHAVEPGTVLLLQPVQLVAQAQMARLATRTTPHLERRA